MEEATYLQAGSALVTSGRIEIGGQTFAVRNVGSVRVEVTPRKWIGGAALLLVGLSLLMSSWPMGVAALAGGAWLLYSGGPQARLVLVAGGGEVAALTSRDHAHVKALRDAVAQAIAAR